MARSLEQSHPMIAVTVVDFVHSTLGLSKGGASNKSSQHGQIASTESVYSTGHSHENEVTNFFSVSP